MHPCLFIQEILLNTFDFLYNHYDHSNPDLASLARCCKAFHVPAITVLWYHQVSLTPLLHCLPLDAWHLSSDESLALPGSRLGRDLRPDDYTRIKHYASHIRILGTGRPWDHHSHFISPSLLLVLWSCNPEKRSLIPTLRQLAAPLDYFEGSGAYARLAIGPYLQALQIDSLVNTSSSRAANTNRAVSWDNIVALLEPTQGSLTSLTLNFELAAIQTPLEGALTSTISSDFHNLKSLHIKSIPVSYHNLRRLLLLNKLEDMSIILTIQPESQSILHRARTGNQAYFSNLRKLTVSTIDLDFVRLLLLDISFKLLEEVTIQTHQSAFLNLNGLFTVFAHSFAHTKLKAIEVSRSRWILGGAPADMLGLTLPAVVSLFPFTSLTELKLRRSVTPILDSSMLKQIVNAWPNLRILHLEDQPSSEAPKLKLSSLLIIATTCAVLEELAIRFDARNCPPYRQTNEIRPCTSLHKLHVFTSPAESAVHVASFLILTFPGLSDISDAIKWPNPDHGETKISKSTWRKVKSYWNLEAAAIPSSGLP